MCIVKLEKSDLQSILYKNQMDFIKGALIKRRVDEKITQSKISELLGTTRSVISRFESKCSKHEHKASLKFFNRYANAVGMYLTVSISESETC